MSRISKKIPVPKQMPNMPSMSKNTKDAAKKDETNSSASSSESSSGGSLN